VTATVPQDGTRTLYRIRVGATPDNESLTASVKLTVLRIMVDGQGNTVGRTEKVRDPITITGWSLAGAQRKAARRGKRIVNEDQIARGVRPTDHVKSRR
jgi:hypothetical protein